MPVGFVFLLFYSVDCHRHGRARGKSEEHVRAEDLNFGVYQITDRMANKIGEKLGDTPPKCETEQTPCPHWIVNYLIHDRMPRLNRAWALLFC